MIVINLQLCGGRGASLDTGKASDGIYVPEHDAEQLRYIQAWGKGLPANPELTGSEKQIKWANDIRDRKRSDMVYEAANGQREAAEYSTKVIEDILQNETSAKYWIDNRNNSAGKMMGLRGYNNPKYKKYTDFFQEVMKRKGK